MAKNKHKQKLQAVNNASDVLTQPTLEKQAVVQAELTAKNALENALRLSNWDTWNYNQSLSSQNGYNNISLELLTLQQILLTYLYKTFGILGKVIDIPVDDAYKNGGFDLDADSISEDEIKELGDDIQKSIRQLKTAGKWKRLFGGAALIVLDGKELDKPLDMKSLYKQPFDLMPVDRWQLQYSLPDVRMGGGTYTVVNYGKITGNSVKQVHPSRVFIMQGKEAPYLIMQQVNGWGVSVYEQIFQDMSQFFKARNVMFELLDEAKTDVLKLATLQTALMSASGEAALTRMVDMIAQNKNYKGQITLSKDDDYEQKSIAFSGFEGILKEIRVMMAGSANMPVNKLWGEGVTGFGSGEDSLENYNSQIENEIRSADEEVIQWILKLHCYHLFGREVEDLTKTWKALRVLSAKDEQEIHNYVFNNVMQLFDRQLLTPQETMEFLKKKQIFIHDTKALKGELEDKPLISDDRDRTGFQDITK
jgi:phage-related protein (TIGR01555 family)